MKFCPKCKLYKSLINFWKRKPKGIASWCKDCTRIIRRKIQHRNNKLFPWKVTYTNAKQRCNNPKNPKYSCYGGRGIKFLLTVSDCFLLWHRDNAQFMKNPSIDRIDNNGHYCLENCRYIELIENSKKANHKVLETK